MTSITELKESSDELDNDMAAQNQRLPIPKVTVNGGNLEASGENRRVTNGINGKSEEAFNSEIHVGNNNETSEVASTVSGPTFYGVSVVEPCTVAQVQIEEAESVETPEVKVTCVREESIDKEDDSFFEASNGKEEDVSEETSSLDESLENGDEQAINIWIVCRFLK